MAKKNSLKKEIKKGTAVEFKEHKKTIKGKKSIAKKIALDHIEGTGEGTPNMHYYEDLSKMERKAKRGKKK